MVPQNRRVVPILQIPTYPQLQLVRLDLRADVLLDNRGLVDG